MSLCPSFFHIELLQFIQNDINQRIQFEGFDPASDLMLRKLQNNIHQALQANLTDPTISLEEMIASYHFLFGERGPIHLEQSLLRSFSSQEDEKYSLRMYRGLPRLYSLDRPASGKFKQWFKHLPTLRRIASEKAFFQIYLQLPTPSSAKISLFTWVMNDGLGDYIAAFELIEIFREQLPELELSWVVLFPKRFGVLETPRGCKTYPVFYEKDMSVLLSDRGALEILRTSDLILQIPTVYPDFTKLQDSVHAISFSQPNPDWISIGEYGFLESAWFHPESGNRSMGLHFLEKGILTYKVCEDEKSEFTHLQNEQLLRWLFTTATPQESQIAQYRQGHHFYLSYLSTSIGGAVYLHSLIKAHEKDEKEIDLCMPDLAWLSQYIELQNQLNQPLLEYAGVAIDLYHDDQVVPLVKGENAKKIRIFCPSRINRTDFRLLLQLSGDYVGVRGNQSLTEVISRNKGFFYDGKAHSRYFVKDLLALAENRIGSHHSTMTVFRGMAQTFLHGLPVEEGEWVDEVYFQEKEPWPKIAARIGSALQDSDCVEGFKELSRIIAKEHSANGFLCSLIQRSLYHREKPILSQIEEESVSSFANGLCPLSEAIEHWREALVNQQLL